MSRKHFTAIAEILASEIIADEYGDFQCGIEWERCRLADKLAQYFAGENEHFDREKFLTAALAD
jgi:hypothetical protein